MPVGNLTILIEIVQSYQRTKVSIWIVAHSKKLLLFACDISEFAFHFKAIRALRCIFMAATWISVTQEEDGN